MLNGYVCVWCDLLICNLILEPFLVALDFVKHDNNLVSFRVGCHDVFEFALVPAETMSEDFVAGADAGRCAKLFIGDATKCANLLQGELEVVESLLT